MWICRGISSVGRAQALQAWGHRFESGILQKDLGTMQMAQ